MIDTSVQIGSIKLKNRLFMAPTAVYLATDDGYVVDKTCDHYRARALPGHVGLIVVEHTYVTQVGKAKPRQICIANDDYIEGLSKLAEACHANGTVAFCQISHAGGAARQSISGLPPVAPSPMVASQAWTAQEGDGIPRALEASEISQVVADFAAAARRVQLAGFDGVELHSAHAYLLQEFYSPLHNKRTDEYGGSLENRVRIHRAVIAAVREAVGPDFVVGMRFGGCDYEEGGAAIDDAVQAALLFEADGLDYLSVTGGWHAWRRPGHSEPGWFADQAQAVKAAVQIPVLTAGGITTPAEAEELLARGVCDLVGVARPLLKNPNWPEE